MARRQKARAQCLCPHPRGVRGEAEGADHGDESEDCGGATTEEFGRGRWKPAESTEEIEKGKENEKEKQEEVKYAPPWVPNNRYPGRCFSLL